MLVGAGWVVGTSIGFGRCSKTGQYGIKTDESFVGPMLWLLFDDPRPAVRPMLFS